MCGSQIFNVFFTVCVVAVSSSRLGFQKHGFVACLCLMQDSIAVYFFHYSFDISV